MYPAISDEDKQDALTSSQLLRSIFDALVSTKAEMATLEGNISKMSENLSNLHKKLDTVIESGFPDGNPKKHKEWHERNPFTRLLARLR